MKDRTRPPRSRSRSRRPARSHSVKGRMFTSYLMVLLVSFVVGIFCYFWSVRIVRDEAYTRYDLLLNQMQDRIEQNLHGIDQLAFTLSYTTWVTEIVNLPGDTIDPARVSRIQLSADATEVNNYLSINPFYDSITLVFNNKDTVMSGGKVYDVSTFFNQIYHSSTYSESDFNRMFNVFTNGAMLSIDDVTTETIPLASHSKLLTYIHTVPLLLARPSATLLVSIRYDTMLSLLTPISGIESAKVYVVDKANRIVMSNSTDEDVNDALAKVLVGRTLKKQDYVDTDDGQRLLLFRSDPTAQQSPWSYVALIPESAVLKDSNAILYFTLALLGASLLLGLLISYGLFRRNYKPLSTILDRVRSVEGDEAQSETADEYDRIGTAIDRLAKNRGDLETKMGRFVPLAIHGFFVKLLFGNLPTEEIDIIENTLGIGMDSGPWTVAVIAQVDMEERLSSGLRRKISQWETGDQTPVYTVETDQGRVAALIFSDDEKVVLQVVERLRATFREGSGQPMLVGVGTPCASLREIGASYREAVMATHYARITRRDDPRPVFFAEINQDGKLEYNVPSALEDELRNRLRMGDCTRALEILDELEEMNLKSLGSSLFTAHCFYYDLLSTALKVISESGLPILGLANERHFFLMESVPDMKRFIHELYARICESVETQREGRRLRNRTDILDYMEQNLTDENLTLAALADRFDVSVPYLSKFIKDQTGENFVDYIARKRVAFAKTLLSTTAQSIEEIGRKVGYSNPLTFRRAFRKVEGVTPGDFRDAPRKPVSGARP